MLKWMLTEKRLKLRTPKSNKWSLRSNRLKEKMLKFSFKSCKTPNLKLTISNRKMKIINSKSTTCPWNQKLNSNWPRIRMMTLNLRLSNLRDKFRTKTTKINNRMTTVTCWRSKLISNSSWSIKKMSKSHRERKRSTLWKRRLKNLKSSNLCSITKLKISNVKSLPSKTKFSSWRKRPMNSMENLSFSTRSIQVSVWLSMITVLAKNKCTGLSQIRAPKFAAMRPTSDLIAMLFTGLHKTSMTMILSS